jgi:hypothetical protein
VPLYLEVGSDSMVRSVLGKVGPMEGLWLVQEDGGKGERGTEGVLLKQEPRGRRYHLI